MAGKVGFIGLGAMGGPMALNLAKAGHKLVVHDIDQSKTAAVRAQGAELAGNAEAVAAAVERTILIVETTDQAKEVIAGERGIIKGAKPGHIVVCMSTIDPFAARELADQLKAKGIAMVDAPVSGGIKGAVNGTLAVMVSCPKATYDRVEPILKHFGKLFYTGDKPGTAQTAKLANNLMAAAALVITSEAVAMGVKGGVDAKVLIDIINASSGRNSASEDKFPRAVLPGTFDFGFTTGLSYKDVRLCVDEAEAMGVPMVCGSVVRQMLAITNAKYGASSDFTSIAKVLEEWAGVEMRG
jgi:3-hydroxyisobutyrate dehydrogenase-like beta-hydroxyacid dehydrogenase